jgi:hypothetical protein
MSERANVERLEYLAFDNLKSDTEGCNFDKCHLNDNINYITAACFIRLRIKMSTGTHAKRKFKFVCHFTSTKVNRSRKIM